MSPVKLIRHSGSWVHYLPRFFDNDDEILLPEGEFYELLSKRERGPGPAAADWAHRPKRLLTFKRITTPGFFGGEAYFEAAPDR